MAEGAAPPQTEHLDVCGSAGDERRLVWVAEAKRVTAGLAHDKITYRELVSVSGTPPVRCQEVGAGPSSAGHGRWRPCDRARMSGSTPGGYAEINGWARESAPWGTGSLPDGGYPGESHHGRGPDPRPECRAALVLTFFFGASRHRCGYPEGKVGVDG